ncbi:defensin, isoforms B and C-like [Anthonomus grandis grandis]|uniref:defensin, isoforms B and C-like n=1 Tax=Anthonomus grandis grandis TaxID=2921223 RepID=UPI0021656595|nr:defensin, isoforms B and C-like [Anthonomus grandis grandis]
MYKFSLFFVLACVVVIGTYGAPLAEEVDGHVIVKRATCDLLSFEVAGVKLNDSACAAHCLTLKKKGGHCNANKVCVCRN